MHTQCGIETLHVKMPFRSETSRFPGTYNHTRWSCPSGRQGERFPLEITVSQIKKGVTKVYWFLSCYRNYIPHISEGLTPFFELLKETSKFYVPTNFVEDFTNLNKILDNSCQLALTQPLRSKQLIVMSDASFTAAGYAITIEDDPNQNTIQTQNICTHCVWLKNLQSTTEENVNICKKFLSILFAFVEFGHLL